MVIVYTEKGIGLHEKISEAGHWLMQRNGIWVSSNDVEVQAIIDSYTAIDYMQSIVPLIKQEAYKRIVTIIPEWKQSNFNARMNELNELRFTRELTDEEKAEVEAMRIIWSKAKEIRTASDTHEANLKALDFPEVLNYDYKSNWPV